MKIIENITLYKCDFCSKELKRKYAMERHENRCYANPVNHRPCLNGCVHLERREIEYDTGSTEYYSGEPIMHYGNTFFCKKFEKFMLHPKTKWLTSGSDLINVVYQDKEVTQEDMPMKCDGLNYGLL